MGTLFKVPGYALYFVGGLWALFISFGIVHEALGTFGVVAGLIFFPFTLYLAPFYAGFAHGNWFPLILSYGSGIGAIALIAIGTVLERKPEST